MARKNKALGGVIAKSLLRKGKSAKPKKVFSEEYGIANTDKIDANIAEDLFKNQGFKEGTKEDLLLNKDIQNFEIMYDKQGRPTQIISRERMNNDKVEETIFEIGKATLEDVRSYMGYAEGGSVQRNQKLKGGQAKIDANKDGKISEQDFVLLRQKKQKGGLLTDDRQSYALGSIVSKLVSKNFAKRNPTVAVVEFRGIDDKFGITKDLNELKKLSSDDAEKALDYFKTEKLGVKQEFKERGRLDPSDADYYGEVERKKIYREIDNDYEEIIKTLNSIIKREQKAEGGEAGKRNGSMKDQMEGLAISVSPIVVEEEMKSDSVMEDDYIDFVVSQSLNNDEQEMLMKELESNPELSTIFDKVLETASEFAGSGPVEGPGSAVSDSIPARLSDGEFVFTTKAAKEIGADNLQRMMDDAEAKADQRQNMQEGGEAEEEKDTYGRPIMESDKDEEIKKAMLGVNPRLA